MLIGNNKIIRLLISGIFLFSISYSYSQSLNKELDKYLTVYYQTKDVPSISAGVARNGKIIWLGTRGYADIENHVPALPQTVYRIASVSKPITAVAIMQLYEEGKIDLDADVRKYIPYFPALKWKFTTRQILSHTSGIRDYRPGEFNNKEYFRKTKDVINYLAKDTLDYEPGTKYQYTTLAYNLLAAIIENVSGLSYYVYLSEKIFKPSGMNATFTEVQRDIISNRARGYTRNEERKIKNAPLADLSIKYPGGGIISTSEDLLKFAVSLMQGRLIKQSTFDSMLVPTKLKNGRFINYGLGFSFGTDTTGRKFFRHEGGGTGFSSLLLAYPSENLAAVHLINIRDRNLDYPASTLASILLKEKYVLPKKSLADYLVNITLKNNVDSAIAVHKRMSQKPNLEYNITSEELNLFGGDLLAMNRNVEAIKFFKFFLTEYPTDINGYFGLANAYQQDGNIGLAINSYLNVLRIDPLNTYADDMVRRLNKNKN